jgi:uncharacterized protein
MSERHDYKPGLFCWADVMAKDAKALTSFYTQLFGWTAELQPSQSGPTYYIFKYKGKSVCGLAEMPFMMKAIGMPVVWNSYISVDNADAAAQKTSSLGGSISLPVMDIPSAGRLAFLKDPEWASFAVWQKGKHFGAEIANEPNTWCWNELYTRSTSKAEEFYGKLFGWSFENMNGDSSNAYRLIQHPDAHDGMNGGLMPITKEMGSHPACWGVYFNVTDLKATVEKLKSLGGKVNLEPFTIEVGDISVVSDPQGGIFNLIQMKQ